MAQLVDGRGRLAAVSLVLGLLASCGGDETTQQTGGTSATASSGSGSSTGQGGSGGSSTSGSGGGGGATAGSGGAGGSTGAAGAGGSMGSGGSGGGSPLLDPTFGNGGVVATGFGLNGDRVHGAARQADGKILVVGGTEEYGYSPQANGEMLITRFGTTGQLDTTFGAGGHVLLPVYTRAQARAVAVQPDQKIVVAGEATYVGASFVAVARFGPNGTIDGTFGAGTGYVTLPKGLAGAGYALALQPDAKIVVAGNRSGHIVVARLLPDGSLDAGFGTGLEPGIIELAAPMASGSGRAVAIQPDGKVVVAGWVSTSSSTSVIAVARLLDNGMPDPAFGGGAIVTTAVPPSARGLALAIQPDGKLVVAGDIAQLSDNYGTEALVLRYDAGGTLDTTFGGGDGIVSVATPGSDGYNAVALQPDGKIVAGGYLGGIGGAITRLSSDGSLDATFNGGGTKTAVFGSGVVRGLAIEPGGGIVAGGYTTLSGPPEGTNVAAARLLATGVPDIAFGTVGLASANSGASKDMAVKVALLPNGDLVAAGSCTRVTQVHGALSRYSPSGMLDPAFGAQGILAPAAVGNVQSVAATAGGHILVMGPPAPAGAGFKIARYDASGVLDTSFGQAGTTPAELASAGGAGRTMLVDPQGRIVAGGHTTTDRALFRFLPTGQLDTSFDQDGRVTTPAMFARVDAMALQQDGKILLAGVETPASVVARYDSSGLLDPAFGTAGTTTLPINSAIGAITQLSSGAILLSGYNAAQLDLFLMRLDAAGNLDAAFGTGGKASVYLSGGTNPFSTVLKAPNLVVLPDDRILVAGTIAEGAIERLLVIRFLADGTPDTSFGPGGQAVVPTGPGSFNAFDMLRQPDGRLVIAGRAFSPTGGTDFGLVRLVP